MTELISVLMPIGPRAHWLDAAVASLVGQTHEEWQLIAILDGECEENRAVLEQPELHGRVSIHTSSSPGIAAALNTALALSRTRFVARFDSDDLCVPWRLESQWRELRQRPDIVVMGSGADLIDGDGSPIGVLRVPTGPARVHRRLRWRNALVHPSVMMRRDSIVRVGGYNVACERAQDYELWLRLAEVGSLDNIAEPLIHYRRHTGQHSRPIVGSDARVIRAARRRATGAGAAATLFADARHLVWLSVQHARAWQRG